MGKKILEYKMFKGSIEYSKEDNCYFGKILYFGNDLVLYEGYNLDELEENFIKSVDDHIDNLTEEEKEDLHLLALMEQVDRNDIVTREDFFKALNKCSKSHIPNQETKKAINEAVNSKDLKSIDDLGIFLNSIEEE